MSPLTKNILASFGGKGWTTLVSLVCIPIYIHFMGIEVYGLIGLFVTLQAMLSVLDFGFSATLNRQLARFSKQEGEAQNANDLVRTLETVSWIVASVVGLLLWWLAPLMAVSWLNPEQLSLDSLKHALAMIGLIIALQFPLSLYSSGFIGLQRMVQLNVLEVLVGTLRSVGSVLVLWLVSPSIQAFFGWQIGVTVMQTILFRYFLKRSLPKAQRSPRINMALFVNVWRFAVGMTGITILGLILTHIDKIILSKILTLEAFGYFSLATVVAGITWRLIGPIHSAVFPRFSQLVAANETEELARLYHSISQLMAVVILPIVIVVALFTKEVMLFWTGNPKIVENTHLVLTLLIIGNGLNSLMTIPYTLQLAHGWTKLTIYRNMIAIIILLPMIIFATIHFGAIGAACMWLLRNVAYILIYIPVMHWKLLKGEKWRWYFDDLGRPLLAGLLTAGLCRWCIPGLHTPIKLFVAIAATYFATLAVTSWNTPIIRGWICSKIAGDLKDFNKHEMVIRED